jgi:hypothetical protein
MYKKEERMKGESHSQYHPGIFEMELAYMHFQIFPNGAHTHTNIHFSKKCYKSVACFFSLMAMHYIFSAI